jgi:hypothetical protein
MAEAYREVVLKLEKFWTGLEATIDSKLISAAPIGKTVVGDMEDLEEVWETLDTC